MELNLLTHKRERDPSSPETEKDLDSSHNPKKQKKIDIINPSNPETSQKNDTKTESIIISKIDIEKNENSISELVFKLNTKSAGIECFICQKDLSKNIKFLCSKCGNKIFCIKCLITKKHSPEHEYQIIDNLNYSLFTDDWTAAEEYNLLHNLSICGLNNWEDVSNIIGRGQVECESHYYSFYYKEKENPLPKESDIILEPNKNINTEILEKNKTLAKNKSKEVTKSNINSYVEPIKEIKIKKKPGRYIGLRKNLKPGEAETAEEILGYRPKRHEFETEFLNDTEIEISHLEFDDNDKEEDLKIKYNVLKDYNLRIKEREERKKFVFEKGLLDLRRENRIESKLTRDDFELLLYLKPFARFYENSEFFDLFEGICLEKELKLALKNLNKLEKEKTSKGEKICSLEDIENFFDIDRNMKKTRKSGDFYTNISEPKNLMTFLGHRVERFMQYQRDMGPEILNEENSENKGAKKLFEDDEYKLVKEMPLARSTFYDIKLRAKNMVEIYKDKKSFSDNFNKLLEKYDLEEKTKNEISEFYITKFQNIFDENSKNKENNDIKDIKENNDFMDIKYNKDMEHDESNMEMKSLNSINIEKFNDKNKLINIDVNLKYKEEQNNNNSKRADYVSVIENFKKTLENEDNI